MIAALTLVLHSNANSQTASLESHCDDIKTIFDAMKFNGDYKLLAYAWIKTGCKGNTPVPAKNDHYNIGWFNTAAGILQNGGGIYLTR